MNRKEFAENPSHPLLKDLVRVGATFNILSNGNQEKTDQEANQIRQRRRQQEKSLIGSNCSCSISRPAFGETAFEFRKTQRTAHLRKRQNLK